MTIHHIFHVLRVHLCFNITSFVRHITEKCFLIVKRKTCSTQFVWPFQCHKISLRVSRFILYKNTYYGRAIQQSRDQNTNRIINHYKNMNSLYDCDESNSNMHDTDKHTSCLNVIFYPPKQTLIPDYVKAYNILNHPKLSLVIFAYLNISLNCTHHTT